jgi:hypothetical protein
MVKRVKLKFPRHEIPGLVERPGWWQVRPEEIIKVVEGVKKGHAEQIAETPGGFPVWSVTYGPPRAKPGTARWASSSASGNVATYKIDEAGPQVVIVGCCIHGAEPESAAGLGGGHILQSGDGQIMPDYPLENVLAYLEEARTFGRGPMTSS